MKMPGAPRLEPFETWASGSRKTPQINHARAGMIRSCRADTPIRRRQAQSDDHAAQKFCHRSGTARQSHPQLHAHAQCRNIPDSLTGHSPPSLNERYDLLTSPEKIAAWLYVHRGVFSVMRLVQALSRV